MSIFDKQQDLENESDQALIQLGQQPNPQYPSYLVMAEVERRRDMRQRHEAEMAKHQAANPPDIATQRMAELGGIAGVDPAMGQGPPPEDMAALQGGIAGGPPPGMEQMGGPPPGMEGPPPMMAYGGLIPGYQNGGAYPDPDQDLYSQNPPGTEDYERVGLWDRMGERREEVSENRRRLLEGSMAGTLTPEQQLEFEEMLLNTAMGGTTGVAGAGRAAAAKFLPKVTGAVGSRLPGAARRAAREAVETARAGVGSAKGAQNIRDAEAVLLAAEQKLKGAGGWLSGLKPGSSVIQGLEREVTFATKAADEAAAVPGAINKDGGFAKTVAGQLATRTAAARDAAIKALKDTADPRGLPRRLLGGIGNLYKKHPWWMGAGTAGALELYGQERAAGGLIPGYHEGDLVGDHDHGYGPDQHLADFLPQVTGGDGGDARLPDPDEDPEGSGGFFDPSDQGWLLDRLYGTGRGATRLAGLPFRIAGRALPADWDIPLEDAGQSGDAVTAADRLAAQTTLDAATTDKDQDADVLAYLREIEAAKARRRSEDRALAELRLTQGQGLTDTVLSRLQTPSAEQIERRKLWADEADDETDLLARELGLSAERVDELRREMRTEKETDHTRKARLFSGLGAALMGSPRGLGSALQSTTTGLEDLDEKLRVERRRDLGDVYTQRAKGLSAERSGRAGIRSLRDKRFADIIEQQTAGEGPAYQAMMDMYGRQMAADTQRYGSRMSLEAQMLNQKLTSGQVDPRLWTDWEILFDEQISELNDPGSIHYDADEALRLEELKVKFGTLLIDRGAANLGAGNDLGLIPTTLQTSR